MKDGADSPDGEVIERYYAAMRVGAAALEDLLALFAADAVYVEPFGGEPATHVGTAEIRRTLVQSQQYAPADMTLSLDELEVQGGHIRTTWTCTAPAFPRPMRGQDLWLIRNGKIQRLETAFLP